MPGMERKQDGFYKPAMVPSFVDSKRSSKLGLGLNLGGCCASLMDVTSPHRVLKLPSIRKRRQDHVNPLFGSDNHRAGSDDRFEFQPLFQPPPSPPPTPRSTGSSPLVIPTFPAEHDDDLEFRRGRVSSPNPSHYRSSSSSSSSPSSSSSGRYKHNQIQWRGVDLPVYEGQWNADAIDEWVSKMDSFFQICCPYMSEHEKIHCAALHLSGTAHKWWRIVSSSSKIEHRHSRSSGNSPTAQGFGHDRNGSDQESKISTRADCDPANVFKIVDGNSSKIEGVSPIKDRDPFESKADSRASEKLSKMEGESRNRSKISDESVIPSKIDQGSRNFTDTDEDPLRNSKKPAKINGGFKAMDGSIHSWDALKRELRHFFMPNDVAAACRGDRSLLLRRLEGMKQEYGMPLCDYDQQYLEVYLDAMALDLPPWDVVLAYVDGLWNKKLSHLLTHMVSSSRVSLQAIMRLASFFECDPSMVCPWCKIPFTFSSCS